MHIIRGNVPGGIPASSEHLYMDLVGTVINDMMSGSNHTVTREKETATGRVTVLRSVQENSDGGVGMLKDRGLAWKLLILGGPDGSRTTPQRVACAWYSLNNGYDFWLKCLW